MNATAKLDLYLESFRKRLRKLTLLRGAALLTTVVVIVGAVGAWFSIESGFSSTTTNVFRIILVLALGGTALAWIGDPLKRLRDHLDKDVEKRVPAFDGRITTYAQLKQERNPFTDLLAEDALKISARHPVETQVREKDLNIARAGLGLAILVLLYLLIAAPGLMNYSMRNLLGGWMIPNLLPPQSISVLPGDQSVRRGANLRITSTMSGFDPDEAAIHIRNDGGQWQEVAMARSPLGYEFTFFSLQKDVSYYVSSNGMRSPEYNISVVDVPGIQNLSLTYNFPDWTEREPETSNRGDVQALPETRIDLTVTTTAPLPAGQLVLNDAAQPLNVNGTQASTSFEVTQEGQYYIAAVVGGETVRISDDFFIRLAEDGKPEIKISKPGGDYNASGIEEVLTRVEAKDDYGLSKVTLHYSVNGGEFQQVDLSQEHVRELTAEHLFMLEEMTTLATRAVQPNVGEFEVSLNGEEAEEEAAPEQRIPLVPGDIISYYAEASDRTQTVRTDMYFIQVQPYNRRYSQSQMSGGGGGAAGGQQDEISQRQRQIIVSTWNLIREQTEGTNEAQVEINSKLLSDLQSTLAQQAQTLAERARARELARDEQIREFVNNMERAVQSMRPASERLAMVELNEAIQPAQEALQYLLRAESVFNDLTITQQQGGGGGGGGRASQDLAEMFELEMDLSLNQYETGNRASPQQQQREAEDLMKQLDELAKRQQQLANSLRNQRQLTEAQRYQQEMLRRQAEELQRRLEQLQRGSQSQQQNQQTASNQQGQQGQQGQEGQQGQQGQQSGQAGQAGQSGSEAQAGEQQNQQVAQSELQRRMESAMRAMQQAAEGMQGNLSPEEMQRAAEEASRQLQEARNQIAQDQLAGLQQTFANLSQTAQDMVREQERMERQLQAAMEKAVRDRESGTDPNSRGMTVQEEVELAQAKEELSAELQRLQQQMLNAAQSFGNQVPQASDELKRANDELSRNELPQAISDAALYINAGYGLYIAGNESAVTQGLRNLADRLRQAQQLAENAAAPGDSNLDRARRTAQELRNQLQQLAQGGQPGQQGQQGQEGQEGQEGQAQGEQQDQQGQQGQQGQQQAQGQQGQQGQQGGQQGGQAGGQQVAGGGGAFNGGRFGPRTGPWNGNDDFFNGPINLPEQFFDNIGNLTQTARDALQQMDLNNEELARMYDLIRQLEFQQTNRNTGILAQEYGEMLALIEQLELGLRLGAQGGKKNVRTATTDQIPEEYRDSVAEYFRRLSRDPERATQQ